MFITEPIIRILNKFVYKCKLVSFKFKYPNVPIFLPIQIGTFYSQKGQDLYLSALLFDIIKNDHENLWVIDVGCNHPSKYSNSLFFEKYFKIRVMAIDAIQEFERIWSAQRPQAKFIATAVGANSGIVKLNIPSDPDADNMFSFVESGSNKKPEMLFQKRTVSLTRLADLIKKFDIKEILFISIDIEGFELEALKGIDFEVVKIYCIIFENNSHSLFGSEEIREFLEQKGFQFCFRIDSYDDVFVNSLFFKENTFAFREIVNL